MPLVALFALFALLTVLVSLGVHGRLSGQSQHPPLSRP